MDRVTVALMAIVVAAIVTVAGCAGGDDSARSTTPLPLVGEIAAAVEAVRAELGGEVEFFEINADARLVNLFVAGGGGTTATAYVVIDGELQPPAPPQEVASGFTFAADAVELDADRVLGRVTEELPGSSITRFVLLGGPDGTIRREVLVTSRQGGTLAVEVGPDGAVFSVEPL